MTSSEHDVSGGFDWRSFTPDDSPMTPMDMMRDAGERGLLAPDVGPGDRAFDFDLPVYDFADGTRVETGRRFRLLDVAARRPVALVFGSYT